MIEQDLRAIKRITRPMTGIKPFAVATADLSGIELMHLIREGRLAMKGADQKSAAEQFCAPAGQVRPA